MDDTEDDPASADEAGAGERRRRRWLLRGGLALAAVWLLYLAGANAFLHPAVGPGLVSRKPEKLLVEWRGGWTLVPGWVRLRGVRLRGQTRNVQWYAELERAAVLVDLPALAVKRFRALDVSGRGLSFRLRGRRDADARDAPAPIPPPTPPIPGLENPPEPPPEALQPGKPKKRRWEVRLDRVDVEEVREVWIQGYRYRGEGRLAGNLRLEVRGPLEVDSARLVLDGGEVTRGAEGVARDVDLDLEVRLDRFVPREQRGRGALRHLSGRLRLGARVESLAFLGYHLAKTPWLDLEGAGRVAADLEAERGVLVAGSRLEVAPAEVEVTYARFRAAGRGRIEGRVEEDGTAVVGARLDRFDLTRPGAEEPHAAGEGFTVTVEAPELDLAAPATDLRVVLDLPRSEIPDLAAYDVYLPPAAGLTLESGRGWLRGRLEVDTAAGTGRGEVELSGRGLAARFRDRRLRGDLHLAARLSDADLEAGRFRLGRTRLDLSGVAVGGEGGAPGAGDWWGRIEVPDGEVRLAQPLQLDARFQARLKDSGPVVAVFASRNLLVNLFEGLLTVEDLEARGRVRAAAGEVALDDLRLTGDDLTLLADLRFARERRQGLLFAELGPVAFAVELAGEEREWKVRDARRWFETRRRAR